MAKIVEYWPKGYADKEGSRSVTIEDHEDPKQAVREIAGPYAEVFSVRPVRTPSTEAISEEYRNMMSGRDNS